MVRGNRSAKAQLRETQGLESPEAEYQAKMVQRFEKTGKLATSSEQRGVKLTSAQRRMMRGEGPLTVKQLREFFEQQAPAKTTYSYVCADCGQPCEWPRKAGKGPAPKCGVCRRQARLATKRRTWHKNREKYLERKHNESKIQPDHVESGRGGKRGVEQDVNGLSEKTTNPAPRALGRRRVVWSPSP